VKYRVNRILVKNGNSYTVALPRVFLFHMRLFRGAEVELVYDDDTDTVTVKAIGAPNRAVKGAQSARGVRPVL